MHLCESLLFFGIPAAALYLATHIGMPFLINQKGIPILLSWFIAGAIIFLSLFLISIIAYKLEGTKISFASFKKRFRLNPLHKEDWIWTISVFIFTISLMGIIFFIEKFYMSDFTGSPSFLNIEALSKDQLWFLIVWMPFFFFNIAGEELLWRGYILPRQEVEHKKLAWLVNALFWAIFHISFGWKLIVMLSPIFFLLPYVVQKRKNTWIGIFIHGVINGGAFLFISLSSI